MLHFGEKDKHISLQDVDKIKTGLSGDAGPSPTTPITASTATSAAAMTSRAPTSP